MLKAPPTSFQKKQLINCFIGDHDLICSCNNPAVHCLRILIDQLKPELQKEDIKQLQQCLGETTTTGDAEDGGIDPGDLEKLFSEDADDDTADTR